MEKRELDALIKRIRNARAAMAYYGITQRAVTEAVGRSKGHVSYVLNERPDRVNGPIVSAIEAAVLQLTGGEESVRFSVRIEKQAA